METALTPPGRTIAVSLAGALMVAVIGAMAFTGRSPGPQLQPFEAHGIVAAQPSSVTGAEIRSVRDQVVFRRGGSGSWTFDQPNGPAVPSDLASHLETALEFMHASAPTRILDPSEYRGAPFAEFGLDPPAYLVSLEQPGGSAITAAFGALNPAGTSQYVRLIGQARLYLMPRHVGAEWELAADMARRIAPPSAAGSKDADGRRVPDLLLPASIERVWAVEIVFEGKLHRFERDGAGNWFLHLGQHTHAANTPAHVADPAQAAIIATALAGLDETQIESRVAQHPDPSELERYGLGRPMMIALAYPRDSSQPLARIEIGNLADDGFDRYARIAESGNVVTIAASSAARLIELLKAVGAPS